MAISGINQERTAFLTTYTCPAGEAITINTACYLKSDGKAYMIDDTAKPPVFYARNATTAADQQVELGSPFPSILAKVGGTATIGSLAQISTNGVALDATSDNVWVAGTFLASGVSGETVEMLLHPHVTNDVSALDAD